MKGVENERNMKDTFVYAKCLGTVRIIIALGS